MSGFRRHGRKSVKCPLKFSHEGIGDFFAETIDVSESGIFVSTKDVVDKLTVGDRVNSELSCSLDTKDTAIISALIPSKANPSVNPAPTQAELKVVRVTYDGAGLAFA